MQMLALSFLRSLVLMLLLVPALVWGQSSHTVTTTSQQDEAVTHWLEQLAAGENSDASSPAEALQFMLDRTLRGYGRQLNEHNDRQVADAYRNAPTAKQAEIRQLLGLQGDLFGTGGF